MRIIDISQEVLSCRVFPGDDSPKGPLVKSMADGELYNLSMIDMCAHNGTHVDAPFHFINEGKYFLSAAPLNFAGFDGAPCRAYLVEIE